MKTKPIIKLTLSPFDNALEWISRILLLVMWSMTLYIFFKLPATIPVHFNAAGQADNFGNKITLFILPVLSTIIYFGLTQINKYPHVFNYLKKITVQNALRQYTIATRMLRFIKLAVLLLFSLIVLFTYRTTIGVSSGLGTWFLPLAFGFLFLPVIVLILQSLKEGYNKAS